MKLSFILLICALLSVNQAVKFKPVTAEGLAVGSPVKAIYIDWHLDWNNPQNTLLAAVNAGYNVIITAFYLSGSGPTDFAQAWAALNTSTKQSTMSQAHSKGAVVLISLGGSTDSPYSQDAHALGVKVGQWAKAQYLDGVDFDLENIAPGFKVGSLSTASTIDWFGNVTVGAANGFGSGAVITHAPQAPYFGPVGSSTTWVGTTGGYTAVYKRVANYITFFNVQFYNQGSSCYVDYAGLFQKSCSTFPSTSVGEIASAGIPLSKIVIGKPVTTADASNGWLSGSSLNSLFSQAKSATSWNAGLMGWVWNDQATCTSWVKAVYP